MNGPTSLDPSNRIVWFRGIPPVDFWIRREVMIHEFIQKHALAPIDMAKYESQGVIGATQARMAEAPMEKAALPLRRPPFPGGMRIAHLHFDGEVYALDAEQWKAFVAVVVHDLAQKLANASVLSFDDVRDIAEGIDKLGHQ